MKEIFMPIGIAGIGKSTFLKQQLGNQPYTWLSSDAVRKELTGDEADISQDKKVWPIVHDRFRKSLRANTPETQKIVLDATFLKTQARKTFLDMMREAVQSGQQIMLHVFEFPMNARLAIERQNGRDRKVPEFVIHKMANTYEPFTLAEAQGINARFNRVSESGALTRVAG